MNANLMPCVSDTPVLHSLHNHYPQALQAGGRSLDVFIQVNPSGEARQYGLAPDDVASFIKELPALSSLRVRGLMTLALLRTLRDELQQSAPPRIRLNELSMGMSCDFETAIEEGATVVRVGHAIFSARALPDSHDWPTNPSTENAP